MDCDNMLQILESMKSNAEDESMKNFLDEVMHRVQLSCVYQSLQDNEKLYTFPASVGDPIYVLLNSTKYLYREATVTKITMKSDTVIFDFEFKDDRFQDVIGSATLDDFGVEIFETVQSLLEYVNSNRIVEKVQKGE